MSPAHHGPAGGGERGWAVTCPKCTGRLDQSDQPVLCGNCGYAPRHGAD